MHRRIELFKLVLQVVELTRQRGVIQIVLTAIVNQARLARGVPLANAVARAAIAVGRGFKAGFVLDVRHQTGGRRVVAQHLHREDEDQLLV